MHWTDSVRKRIRLLHFWTNRADAEKLVRSLAETPFEFEAKLVKTSAEYVSALAGGKFDLIIADQKADPAPPGSEDLSLFQIAEEIAPGTPVLLLCETQDPEPRAECEGGCFRLPWRRLHALETVLADVLKTRKDLDAP